MPFKISAWTKHTRFYYEEASYTLEDAFKTVAHYVALTSSLHGIWKGSLTHVENKEWRAFWGRWRCLVYMRITYSYFQQLSLFISTRGCRHRGRAESSKWYNAKYTFSYKWQQFPEVIERFLKIVIHALSSTARIIAIVDRIRIPQKHNKERSFRWLNEYDIVTEQCIWQISWRWKI